MKIEGTAPPPRKRDSMGRFLPSGNSSKSVAIKNYTNPFDGASYSPVRGYIYYPNLDSSRDLTCYTLFELRRRSRWLYVNFGFATRCIDGVANMVGALTPVPLTSDKEWNAAALKSFNNIAYNNAVFDLGGRYNFESAQVMMTRCRLIDGDILGVLTESTSGFPAMQFYEAHQVDNSTETTLDQSQWNNGVRTNAQGRPIQYRIVTGADAMYNSTSPYTPYANGQRSVDIDAADAIFYCDFRRPGRVRGEPALRHAINHMLDWSEILAYTKTSVKNAATIGWQIVKNAPYTGPYTASTVPKSWGTGVEPVTTGTGSRILAENPYGSGKQADMDPGEEIKLLSDQRPSPNTMGMLDHLARQIAWGLNCSPEILWNMEKLGGATVRYVLADAQQTLIEPMQELLADQFCTRFWVYYVAKEMKAGRLPKCKDPQWWNVGWQPQRKLTVDIGRDGALFVDMHKSGLISAQRFFSQQGQRWDVEINQYLDERKYVVEGVKARGMTMDEAFPPAPGSANVQVTEQADPTAGDSTNPESTPTSKPAKGGTRSPNAFSTPKNFMEFFKLMATWNKNRTDTPPAAPTINVTTPPVNVNVQMPEQKAPIANISPIFQAKPPTVNVAAPTVNIPKAEAPIIKFEPQVTVNPTPVTVNNEIKMPKTKSVKFVRDENRHQIASAVVESE